MSEIEHSSFGSGFAAGAVSSIVSSSVEAIGQSGGYYTDEDYTNWSDLASRNPELIKASMIAAGGLSGGLSSSIAGGSFWAGARQGLITSGLNHVAHMVEERRSLLSRFKNKNFAKQCPVFSDTGIDNINEGVVGLQEAYEAGGSPTVKFDHTNPKENGRTEPGVVHLNKEKIKTNLALAATLIHEYRHAWQWKYKYNGWMNDHLNNYEIVEHLMERDAYAFQIQFGAGTIANDAFTKYNEHLSLTNWIKKY